MNESNELIGEKPKFQLSKKKKLNLRIKIDKINTNTNTKTNKFIKKYIGLIISIFLVIILLSLFGLKLYKNNKVEIDNDKNLNNKNVNEINENKQTNKPNNLMANTSKTEIKEFVNKKLKFNLEKLQNEKKNLPEDNPRCAHLDPINIFNNRLKDKPTTICQTGNSNHICYKNNDIIFVAKNGVICTMENIILDPTKWKYGGYVYKGPVDDLNRGCPILKKGFFNMKCDNNKTEIGYYDKIYISYFEGWNYDYNEKEDDIEELAPGKIVFFVSRNQDSPNLYHGGSEFVNVVSMLYLLDINPENVQVVFLESITLNDDPFYDLYKNLISRGGEPIYIKNLKKKYLVSSAIHIPINWDSPCFIFSEIPDCKYPTLTYKFYNNLIDKYMNIQNFEDSFKSDNEVFYYPKKVIENHNSKTEFKKIITFQWRRVWPRGRKGQQRILGNGPELAEKLASRLPKNILLRLIDTASLPISQQISILRQTDYYVGIHGAGLCLSIFAPNHCIFHEVLPKYNMNGLLLMASLSGHKTYSDIINADIKNKDGNELVFFNEGEFVERVIQNLKENNLM